ncbi:MAG: ThuA domain-containing protein [Planctomycetota bacterium]
MTRRVAVLGLIAAGLCLLPQASAAVSEQVIAKITAALPEKAPAQPAKPRKLLVFTQALGFVHSSIPVAAKAVELMGQKTGAYEATVTDDPVAFEPENLKQYDAIFLVSTTGNMLQPKDVSVLKKEEGALNGRLTDKKKPPTEEEAADLKKKLEEVRKKIADLPPAQPREDKYKQALLDFVKGGKGLGGAHAATDCYYSWPEYGEMIGGWFSGHPYSKHVAKIDDPTSPLTAAFDGKPYDYSDEMYVFGPKGKTKDGRDVQPYARDKVRVLLSIDSPASKIDITKGGRQDGDYPISWIKSYGDGRVFYSTLGHNEFTWWNPTMLKHYLAGIQFTLGDLKADTTPVPLKPADAPK